MSDRTRMRNVHACARPGRPPCDPGKDTDQDTRPDQKAGAFCCPAPLDTEFLFAYTARMLCQLCNNQRKEVMCTDDHMTVSAAADMLKLSPQAVRDNYRRGVLRGEFRPWGIRERLWVRRDDVEALRTGKAQSGADP